MFKKSSRSDAASSSQWGAFLFFLGLGLAAGAVFFIWEYPGQSYGGLYARTIPGLGLVVSLVCSLLGHFSYPRVHNLKVTLLGYLMGMCCLLFFIFDSRALGGLFKRVNASFSGLLFLLFFLNLLIVAIVPAYLKFKWTKRITFAFVALELTAVYVLGFLVRPLPWLLEVRRPDSLFFQAAGVSIFIAVFFHSIFYLRKHYFLGGILSGCAALICTSFYAPLLEADSKAFETVLVFLVPVYLEAGILVHWLKRMEVRVAYDPLLQIYNRNYCDRIISEQAKVDTAVPFSVGMIDIDHFKKVNDTHGHQAGDDVLANTARLLVRELVPSGIVCRYGGEEIIVFFPGLVLKQAQKFLDAARITVGKARVKNGPKSIAVTISGGVAQREKMSQSIPEIIIAADKALYRAKKKGRNRVMTGKVVHKTRKR